MRILLYKWGACLESGMQEALKEETVFSFTKLMKDYHADGDFSRECMTFIHEKRIEAVFSFDYFPLLSMICNVIQIPYISWIYDCPMDTLLSQTVINSCNHIFCFDRIYAEYLETLGAVHVYYLPLGADVEGFQQTIMLQGEAMRLPEVHSSDTEWAHGKYAHEISFVGNLYNDDKNRFRKAAFSEYHRGILEGLIEAQLRVYGYNFLEKALPCDVSNAVVQQCGLKLGDFYLQVPDRLAADEIGLEVSARERENVLRILANIPAVSELALYSGSVLPEDLKKNSSVKEKGYADYYTQMPLIFANSKINLNITSKTIQSGVPQRVLDILACRGFCITNYQPEIAELFENGKELVMYESMRDLQNKVSYYLAHAGERETIAQAGFRKVQEQFDIRNRWKKMRQILF